MVVLNLQPRKLAGFPSNGMVMAAKGGENDSIVELITPPANAKPGDRVKVASLETYAPVPKIKIKSNGNDQWSQVVPQLKTNDDCVCMFGDEPLLVNGEQLTVATLKNVQLS